MVDSPLVGWGTPTDEDALVPLNYASRALEASAVIKTGPGLLVGITITNTLSSPQYLMVFDAVTLPADGAIPKLAKSIPANDAVGINWIPPRTFLTGIIVCNSTTNTSKTLGLANCIFDAQFI